MASTLRAQMDHDRVLTITLDAPGKSVNTCSSLFFSELEGAVLDAQQQGATALIITSAKMRSFNAGADLYELRALDAQQAREFIRQGQRAYQRLADLAIPTVAAINGDSLGGGFELALACRYRLAADNPSIQIGLPEVKLGLIPAWGGTVRLPRLIGLASALDLLIQGKTLSPAKALQAGLVDEISPQDELLVAARRLAHSASVSPMQQPRETNPTEIAKTLDQARGRVLHSTYGNYPAPLHLIEVIRQRLISGGRAGLDAECDVIVELMNGEVGRNLLRLFFLRQGAKKRAAAQAGASPREIQQVAVVGGGTMGAGIVHALASANIPTRLIEVSDSALSAAIARVDRMLQDDVRAGRISQDALEATTARIAGSTIWDGIKQCDLIIEAVVESIDAKRDVFRRLSGAVSKDVLLATNTSSLSVHEISTSVVAPQRVVGIHFFNPVPRMPLVEVIRTPRTDPACVATAVALAARLGKTPVLANDSPGFIVNRVLMPYLAEAVAVAREGVPIQQIDAAMKRWGMPMGPFELMDEIGLDVVALILLSMRGVFPEPPGAFDLFPSAISKRWLGRKSGEGFYLHEQRQRGAELMVNDTLQQALVEGVTQQSPIDTESIQWRLVLPMLIQAALLLKERVVSSADDIDLATVLGAGMAPFRGGLTGFARSAGAAELASRAAELRTRFGNRFELPASIDLLTDAVE